MPPAFVITLLLCLSEPAVANANADGSLAGTDTNQPPNQAMFNPEGRRGTCPRSTQRPPSQRKIFAATGYGE
jgi:hypothetical protein